MLSPLSSGTFHRPLSGDSTPHLPAASTSNELLERVAAPHRALRFPDELFISRDPQRFNTQLNQQITAVQRAADYLVETESSLRGLAQPMSRDMRHAQLRRTRQLLERRIRQSGGTVDRNFHACVDRPAQIVFHCAALEALLFTDQREIITFGLGEGTFRRWVSLVITPDMPLMQRIFALNRALGQLSIWAVYDLPQQRLVFTLPESRWPQLASWVVRGGGGCFAADSLTLLQPLPIACFEQQLQQLLDGNTRVAGLSADQALRYLQQERQKLQQQRQQVDRQLTQHNSSLESQQALRLAKQIRQQLAASHGSFRGLNQALQCQAHLPQAVVQQLMVGK
ncbi:hypothetical protein EFZ10_14400 [Tatumella sp. TA1]|uniref:hypothetical protein n=1 Tax=Rosenbergiella collisarenosi TaxID=1544695 RepID=UPI0008F89F69|nr:hypothetical protein [Rosenbergiella collisarenosi]MBT0721881.1 hypothetical protein [Rosenbergiella collisarenosi]QGX92706.1 hypothetical protein EFZ10_14400 [Tatumella sp. TA1]